MLSRAADTKPWQPTNWRSKNFYSYSTFFPLLIFFRVRPLHADIKFSSRLFFISFRENSIWKNKASEEEEKKGIKIFHCGIKTAILIYPARKKKSFSLDFFPLRRKIWKKILSLFNKDGFDGWWWDD